MNEETSLAEFGLIAWVYRFDNRGKFTIDWPLTRKMAREIAAAYRKPLSRDYGGSYQEFRNKIAQALELFAGKSCTTKTERSR